MNSVSRHILPLVAALGWVCAAVRPCPAAETLAVCAGVPAPETRDACLSAAARETDDVRLCRRIGDPGARNSCYYGIAVRTDDLDFCDMIKERPERADLVRREYCYLSVALSSGDISVCRRIAKDALRQFCVYGVALKNQDPDLCGQTEEFAQRETLARHLKDCLEGVRFDRQNITDCDALDDPAAKKVCKRLRAVKKSVRFFTEPWMGAAGTPEH